MTSNLRMIMHTFSFNKDFLIIFGYFTIFGIEKIIKEEKIL